MSKYKMWVGVIAMCAIAAVAFGQSQWRGDMNLIDNPSGTSQYQVGGEDIIKCIRFEIIDSLAANTATLGVVTLPRKILVKQIDMYTADAFLGPDPDSSATAVFQSTATAATGYLDSGATYQSTNMTDVSFAAGLACTLFTTDGGGTCTGGALGSITVWYTDD